MTPEQSKKTLLNTDFPIDKIIGDPITGSENVSAFDSYFVDISHNLLFAPLFILKWSNTPNFSVSYDEGFPTFVGFGAIVQSDTSQLHILVVNNTSSSVTIYYRIFLFIPTDLDVIASESESKFDKFVLNTDYNYTKIFDEGVHNSGTGSVSHNLGYFPQCEAWYKRSSDGRIIHALRQEAYGSPSEPTAKVSASSLTFAKGSFNSADLWHYKIYIEEF